MSNDPGFILTSYSIDRYDIKRLETALVLPCWNDFTYRKTDTGIAVEIASPNLFDDPVLLPSHLAALDFLIKEQEKIKERILTALLSWYASYRDEYKATGKDTMNPFPSLEEPAAFQSMISLSTIYLKNLSKEDCAYTGYAFNCSWQEEEGLGILLHQDRVVEIGTEDTAFLHQACERDLERLMPKTETKPPLKSPKPVRPWWKCW